MRQHGYRLSDAATYFGVPPAYVAHWLKRPALAKGTRLQSVVEKLQVAHPPTAEELRFQRGPLRACLRCGAAFPTRANKIYCSEDCVYDRRGQALRRAAAEEMARRVLDQMRHMIQNRGYRAADLARLLQKDPAVLTRWLSGSLRPTLHSSERVLKQISQEPLPSPAALATQKRTCQKCRKAFLYRRKRKYCPACAGGR